MSDEVIFDEDNRDLVGNLAIVPGKPKGMLAWLVNKKVVKNGRQAEHFLLGVTIGAVILAILFVVLSIKSPNSPSSPNELTNMQRAFTSTTHAQ